MKLVTDQGLAVHTMDVVFHALILSTVRYAMCVCRGHLTVMQKNRLNALLHRMHGY